MQPLQPPKKPRSTSKIVAYVLFGIILFMIPVMLNMNTENNASIEEDSVEEVNPEDAIVNDTAEEPEPVVEEEISEEPVEPVVNADMEQAYADFYEANVRPYMDMYDSLWEDWKQVPIDVGSQMITPQAGNEKLMYIKDEYKRMALEVNTLTLPDDFPAEDQEQITSAFRNFSTAMDNRSNAAMFLASEVALIVATDGAHQVDMTTIESASDRADEYLLKATADFVVVNERYNFVH